MRNLSILIILIVVVALGIVVYSNSQKETVRVANFTECAAAGYPIMESYPRQCRAPDGVTYVEEIQPVANTEVRNVNIVANSVVTSPVTVTGEARGSWFFEANLPIFIKDATGKVIGQTGAMAQGEWMTTDYVPFGGTVTFTKPTTETGTLMIANDNPSGLPENAKSIEIPIRFSAGATGPGASTGGSQLSACVITGCSSHICADAEMASTCEFREEYACYRTTNAKCERQSNGSCGWTPSSALTMCINNARANI